MNIRSLLRSIIPNALVPLLLYNLAKHYLNASDVLALSTAAIFPLVESVVGLVRQRRMDVIGVIALAGIAVSLCGVLLGGGSRILLIRESFFTGALGIACFVSLALPRPLMFYFGWQFTAGADPEKLARFNGLWQ